MTNPARPFLTRHGQTLPFRALGYGAAPLGNLYRAISEDVARSVLLSAFEAGYRYFDTAPLYGLGLSETRLNAFLRIIGETHQADEVIISTKVGRILKATRPEKRTGIGFFFNTPSREVVFDYSYDGVMRSFESSLERLGVDKVDILLCHDVDIFTHGSKAGSDARISEFMQGGYRALVDLRDAGTIKAIGAGINEWQVAETLARAGNFDLFLLAGRYTLLEQDALESFLPYCEANKIGVIVGGPFNSGILATGAVSGAFYNYEAAPPDILARVAKIENVCKAHGVPLATAALAFPLAHPTVACVIPGGQTPYEVKRNIDTIGIKIPTSLWGDLKAEGLIRADAPVPTAN